MKKIFHRLLYILKIMFLNNKLYAVIYFLGIFASGIAPVIQLYVLNEILKILQSSIKENAMGDYWKEGLVLICLELFIVIIINSLNDFKEYLSRLMELKITFNLQSEIAKKVENIPISNFDNPEFYNNYNNASIKSRQAVTQLVTSMTYGISIIISTIGYIKIIMSFSILAVVFSLITYLPSLYFKSRLQNKEYKFMISQTKLERKLQYFFNILISKDNAKENKVFSTFHFFSDKRNVIFKQNYNNTEKFYGKKMFYEVIINSFGMTGKTVSIFLLFKNTLMVSKDIAQFTTVYYAIKSLQTGTASLINLISIGQKSLLLFGNFFDFINMQEEQYGNKNISQIEEIEFQEVWFQYPNEDKFALQNISFKLNRNNLYVLVGKNGSGKTTIIKLLLRFYAPTKGKILINGIDIQDIELSKFYESISVMFQDYIKYSMTVGENITFSNDFDEMQLENACRNSNSYEFIHTLKSKFNTQLTKVFDEGEELSIGQWQKIALARALYKKGNFLIFDEPTASLDSVSSKSFFEIIRRAKSNNLTVWITHSLVMIEKTDQIIVLNEGKVSEIGTFDQLLLANKIFKELYNAQIIDTSEKL